VAVEDGVVVGVSVHCDVVVLRCDGGRGETGEVEEYVGWGGEEGDQGVVEGEEESGVGEGDWEEGEGLWDEEEFGDQEEGEEEDL
jgi:hypothetical protein